MTIIDKKTGLGKVLGGKPVKFEDFKDNLKLTRRTYARYIQLLEEGEYIEVTRTPYGLVIYITKAKKLFGDPDKNPKKRYANNGTSPMGRFGTSHTKNGTSLDKYGTSNKTSQLDKPIRQKGFKKSLTKKTQEMPDLTADFYEQFEVKRWKQNA